MKKYLFVFFISISIFAQTRYVQINIAISKGDFTKAESMIDSVIAAGKLDESELYDLNFQKSKMDRIRLDFRKTGNDVVDYVKKFIPEASLQSLRQWEEDGTLECKIIDGTKYYFNRAHANLFRVNKEAKKIKEEGAGYTKDGLDKFLESYLPEVVAAAKTSKEKLVKPVEMKIKYKLVVEADAVPDGEVVRCWMPYPIADYQRQSSIKLVSTSNNNYIISPKEYEHRTLYMEEKAVAGKPTEFEMELTFTGKNVWTKIEPENVKPYDTASDQYKTYTSEVLPHIVFTERIKKLSNEIIGEEKSPVIKAKLIYKWINDNIPWAGAREYSTIDNISDYCLANGWGDCGIQTLTFMTLCRFNGIPTRWQSGWMLHPGEINLHDWCQIYFEGYGWLPVDQSFKLIDSEDEDVRWFYFGGTDAFHFIVNDNISQPLYPAKIYPRSETVDFQRGEVEWRGGNIYFNKWDYFMDVEYLNPRFN